MKKICFLVVLLFCIIPTISSVHAEKQEWYDSGFDFTKVRKIAVLFRPSERFNIMQYNETIDLFMEKMKFDLIDELPAGQYEFESGGVIAQKILRESGVDIASIEKTNLQEADRIAFEYIQKHYDLFGVH